MILTTSELQRDILMFSFILFDLSGQTATWEIISLNSPEPSTGPSDPWNEPCSFAPQFVSSKWFRHAGCAPEQVHNPLLGELTDDDVFEDVGVVVRSGSHRDSVRRKKTHKKQGNSESTPGPKVRAGSASYMTWTHAGTSRTGPRTFTVTEQEKESLLPEELKPISWLPSLS